MKGNKKSMDTNSSAEHVERHLQELEKADYELLYYSQEQIFSADELARLINEERLKKLMAQSDDFLSSVNSEIEDFDE
ncbi:hypothetical protein [Psychrobacter sp. DAB_AL32B]|uniref:hypothetical protein n=1 Tax=Psychrobacter sp. DAB_AL32B TaxID=1028414 RepID=UPI000B7F6EF5|nr:hypothetical protein [Psychrobacter sp. DAB_AL32B]OXL27536.1 hypothetical protein CAN34_01530 [Psychrobacter sp. DAB_AL32B]